MKAVGHFGTGWGCLERQKAAEAVWLAETGCSFREEVAEVFLCGTVGYTHTPQFVCVCVFKIQWDSHDTHPTGCALSSAQLFLLASSPQSLTSLSLSQGFLTPLHP